MEFNESELPNWKDDVAFQSLNDDDKNFAVASSLKSQYLDESKLGAEKTEIYSKDDVFFKSLDDDFDYAIALSLQTEYNEDFNEISNNKQEEISSSVLKISQPLSIVDEEWELIDPHPDVHALFLEYDTKFFYGKLKCVEVKWSKRMTLCAGVCSYEGSGGMCSIRLSVPLLKLRPRKDLIETLLHEMIHAYLFVTHNNKDRGEHGPEFLSHMYRINKVSGTRISVFHSFHDEVDLYRQHWWKCDGPCKYRHPFYGHVKRAMNKAPGPNDNWWAFHQESCGGKFIKVKEPDNYKNKASKRKITPDSKIKEFHSDIRGFMKTPKLNSSINDAVKPFKTKQMKISTITSVLSKDENTVPIKTKEIFPRKNFISFQGSGHKLGGNRQNSNIPQYLSKYVTDSNASSKQNSLAITSVKSVKSVSPFRSSNISSLLKTNYIKNADITSNFLDVQETSPKKLVQSPINKFLFSRRATDGKDIIIKEPDNVNLPSTKEAGVDKNLKVACPICSLQVENNDINSHLDECLLKC